MQVFKNIVSSIVRPLTWVYRKWIEVFKGGSVLIKVALLLGSGIFFCCGSLVVALVFVPVPEEDQTLDTSLELSSQVGTPIDESTPSNTAVSPTETPPPTVVPPTEELPPTKVPEPIDMVIQAMGNLLGDKLLRVEEEGLFESRIDVDFQIIDTGNDRETVSQANRIAKDIVLAYQELNLQSDIYDKLVIVGLLDTNPERQASFDFKLILDHADVMGWVPNSGLEVAQIAEYNTSRGIFDEDYLFADEIAATQTQEAIPTNTPLPPTETPLPTDTSIPPTDTPLPATNTAVPPTAPPPPPTAPPAPSASDITISWIRADGEGSVEPDEFAVITNTGVGTINLGGWRLNAGDEGQDFWFPNMELGPGQSCRVYTNQVHADSCGGGTFGSTKAIWKNDGDCGILYDATGAQIFKRRY